ncbi:glutaredoxin domain-containing protein [Ancylobacter rudongensis]|uniref:Glutaredoxin 3 n=1 Tax=Ancylobacter rudongensis TaxID=177413 RepID=A0A1G4USC5_9HYPH|nr:glutaredoxin domain-containing protein [Ancylobacter rudongensis]SCW95875.1 glutaredoxin 3 [Ancylobacter rudongensis]
MADFHIMTKPGCTYCTQAKALLKERGHSFSELHHLSEEAIEEFKAQGWRTFPQIFHGTVHVGGFDQLGAYLAGLDTDDF